MAKRAITTLTIDLTEKTATASGVMAFRDTVQVILTATDIEDFTAAGLVLYVLRKLSGTRTMCAQCVTFTLNGTQFEGDLDLNTTPLETYFTNKRDQHKGTFTFLVQNTTDLAMLFNQRLQILNNPWEDGMPGPSPVGTDYMPKEPDPETNFIMRNNKLCLWDISRGAYYALWSNNGAVGVEDDPEEEA